MLLAVEAALESGACSGQATQRSLERAPGGGHLGVDLGLRGGERGGGLRGALVIFAFTAAEDVRYEAVACPMPPVTPAERSPLAVSTWGVTS